MLRQGVEAARVMKICGWKELKTMQHYVRLAGIEIEGATNGLRIFSDFSKATPMIIGGTADLTVPLISLRNPAENQERWA